jgi:hypothetical protein
VEVDALSDTDELADMPFFVISDLVGVEAGIGDDVLC